MPLHLDRKQEQILEFIKSELNNKGYPPSVREICSAVNLKSTSTVHAYLNRLEEKGYLRRDKSKPRAIEVLNISKGTVVNIPIVKNVLFDNCDIHNIKESLFNTYNIKDYIPISSKIIIDKNYFIINITDDNSKENCGISKGDFILIHLQPHFNDKDIVLVSDDKRQISLQSNFSLSEMSNTYIIGIVKGIFRLM